LGILGVILSQSRPRLVHKIARFVGRSQLRNGHGAFLGRDGMLGACEG
jgi:hypothetical protein